jgi:gliding motility-associated-like protein
VVFGSRIYRTTGTFRDTLHRAGLCDTAFTIIVTVGTRDTTTTNITVCDLDTIRYLGIDYLYDTTFMSQFARAGRCDSFTRVNLVFNPNPTRIENYTYCNGDTLRIRSKIITAPGVYYDTMRTPALCDTIYQYNVVRSTDFTYTQYIARCAGDSLRVGTHVYTTGGVYRDTFVRGIGCDSVLISTLTIFPNSVVVLNPSICIYDSFRVGTNIYRTAGTYTDHLTNIYGCDSFITTNLSVLPLGTFAQSINICTGDTFVYNRHNYTSAGIYRDTLHRIGQCDSIVTTTLNLLALSAATQNISICTGDTFRVAAHTYTSAGIYRDTFVNAVGCDSVLTTNLSLRPILSYDEYDTICYEDSLFAHGVWRHTTGLYIDTLTSSIACDSFYKIHLQVLAAINATRNIYRCNGDSFLCGGAYQTTSGTYADTLSSTLRGCDSILQTVLLFYPATSDTFYKNICITDSFLAGGSYQDTSGTYADTFINSHGCDSVLFTILRVFPLPVITISNDTSVCLGKSVRLQASANKPCIFLWNIGFSTPIITIGPVLSSTYFVKATDSLGCISYDSVDINIWPLPNVSIDDTTICIGQTARMQANSSTAVRYQWSTGDTTSNIIVHPASSNAYSVTVSDINNCQQHNSGHVTVSQPFVHIDAIPDSLINAGESVWLHAVYGFIDTSLIWSPASGLSNTDSAYTEASPAYSTTYTVALIDENGCPTRDSINIIVIPKDIILVPTGFSPNGDGVNDVLKVVLSPHLELEEFRIYNRWGEEVFNYPKDNRGKGWDGMYKEREQPISTYVWYVVASNKFTGKAVNRNGNVTLLR